VQNRRKPVKEKNILYGIIKAKVKEGIPIILSTAPTQKHTHTHTHTQSGTPFTWMFNSMPKREFSMTCKNSFLTFLFD
jgi:hypothetical protein